MTYLIAEWVGSCTAGIPNGQQTDRVRVGKPNLSNDVLAAFWTCCSGRLRTGRLTISLYLLC